MDESNHSIDTVVNQSDSTDANDNELIPLNVILNRLYEATIAELAESEIKTKMLRNFHLLIDMAEIKDLLPISKNCRF